PLADAARLGRLRHAYDRRIGRQAVELARVDDRSRTVVRLRHCRRIERLTGRMDDDGDGQAVLARELEIALVVARDAHDRAGAVLAEHEVRDPDRHRLSGERIDGRAAGIEPFLLDLPGHPRGPVLRLEPLERFPKSLRTTLG